jgi:hypothetical protein
MVDSLKGLSIFSKGLSIFSVGFLTPWFQGKGPGNTEFGRGVSKAWPKIVPTRNQIRVLPN